MIVEEWQWHTAVLSPLAYWFLMVAGLALLIVAAALNAIILRKAGHSGWWAVLVLFPLLYFIGVWIFAWSRWPRAETSPPIPGQPTTAA
ncbi:MAG: hypothetical protein M0006_14765 [Magnetospirillum sp.]|nr:hypothetical protein [Magnetospirillum sp.]